MQKSQKNFFGSRESPFSKRKTSKHESKREITLLADIFRNRDYLFPQMKNRVKLFHPEATVVSILHLIVFITKAFSLHVHEYTAVVFCNFLIFFIQDYGHFL